MPAFDLSDFEVAALRCSRLEDKTWVMKLPPVTTTDLSPVKVSIATTAIGALFRLTRDMATLSDFGLDLITTEEGCPTSDTLDLKFKLNSKLLGIANRELEIPVDPLEKSFEFDGVKIRDNFPPTFEFDGEYEPLKVS